jgi:hypothetical protein
MPRITRVNIEELILEVAEVPHQNLHGRSSCCQPQRVDLHYEVGAGSAQNYLRACQHLTLES